MDSSDTLLSSIHPKYVTLLCCLILISPYLMSRSVWFFRCHFVPNRIDFVLSSPKWMLSLLSMNYSQRELKSLFSCSSIVLVSFAVYIRQVSSAYNNSSELTACGISFTYKRKSNGPRIEP